MSRKRKSPLGGRTSRFGVVQNGQAPSRTRIFFPPGNPREQRLLTWNVIFAGFINWFIIDPCWQQMCIYGISGRLEPEEGRGLEKTNGFGNLKSGNAGKTVTHIHTIKGKLLQYNTYQPHSPSPSRPIRVSGRYAATETQTHLSPYPSICYPPPLSKPGCLHFGYSPAPIKRNNTLGMLVHCTSWVPLPFWSSEPHLHVLYMCRGVYAQAVN